MMIRKMNRHVLFAMMLLVAGIASCKKSELDGEYTRCERCTYTFTDAGPLTFTYKHYFFDGPISNPATPYRGLSIEVPTGVDIFNYGDKEIASDKVNYFVMCINCGVITLKTVGGTIKGMKINDRKWLLDATIYLESENVNGRDTIVFKQLFTR